MHDDSWGKFTVSVYEKQSQRKLIKETSEALKMVLINPKTGEDDYFDINLVSKLELEKQNLIDIITKNQLQIDFSFHADNKMNLVYLNASILKQKITQKSTITYETFEKILFDVEHSDKISRLEECDAFKVIRDETTSEIMNELLKKDIRCIKSGDRLNLDKGIGVVFDIEKNQFVATFDSASYLVGQYSTELALSDFILNSLSLDEFKKNNRYKFLYYSTDHMVTYEFTSNSDSQHYTDDDLSFTEVSLHISELIGDSYETASDIQKERDARINIPSDSPIYIEANENEIALKLAIISESKRKQKEQALVDQFADIEF